ncbi:MAG: phage terminase large subunit, partial [Gelidibacter sp.]|nr:phage terminase large subunit [Gelidibacter sp.]
MNLNIQTPKWALPLLKPKRYKGAKGGRGSGKSHFFGEALVEAMVLDPNTSAVCIREIQKSLKFSAKRLIEDKIESMGVSNLFTITQSEIRANKGRGVILFQGMQDHTADSIKSLEGFNIAWVEEAQTLSKKSLQLLRPTIRAEGSE